MVSNYHASNIYDLLKRFLLGIFFRQISLMMLQLSQEKVIRLIIGITCVKVIEILLVYFDRKQH